MLLMRRFEEKAGQLYGMEKIRGFCHLYIGQEAIVAGCMTATTPDDILLQPIVIMLWQLQKVLVLKAAWLNYLVKQQAAVKAKEAACIFWYKENFLAGTEL